MSKLIVEMRNNPENCAECLACVVGMDENVFYCAIERSIIAESVLMNRQSWCPIKGEISEIELTHLEEERAFAARNIAAERIDDGNI